MIKRKRGIPVLLFFIVIMLASFVNAPPQPHNVQGIVYNADGSYATASLPVRINDTNSTDIVTTKTNGIGPPIVAATYATTINGSDNDTIIVYAWNSTYYGSNSTTLSPTTTFANVVLNTLRPSEPNVSIIVPSNNTLVNISGYINVTANISIIGGQNAVSCSATLSFNNNGIFEILPGDTASHSLGNITLGDHRITSWNVSANVTGSTNISVLASCTSDTIILDFLNMAKKSNITVQDVINPVVSLKYPENNSEITGTSSPISFIYNVSDSSPLANCSLYVNNQINKTNSSITRGVDQFFYSLIGVGNYSWNVQCADNSTSYNIGASVIYNLSIIPNFPPEITSMSITNPITLSPGSLAQIYCNATVSDLNNVSDITSINTTFHFQSVSAGSLDDDNTHYTNTSCTNISITQNAIDYSCSFGIRYFAEAGNWTCNMTAIDQFNSTGVGTINSTIEELLAIDISPSVINYFNLESGQNSSNDTVINITNIGNIDFNVTLDGFARIDGDGLSMNCTVGNISNTYEHYDIRPSISYHLMNNLSDTAVQIQNFTLPHRTNDTTYKSDRNFTYWKMGIPLGIRGECSGYVQFVGVI